MGLFCAPAWMMKGSPQTLQMLSYSDSDPYKTRKKVRFSLSGFTYWRNQYRLEFTITASDFSESDGMIWLEVNRDSQGNRVHHYYYDIKADVDLNDVGSKQTIDFSRLVYRSPEAKLALDYTSNSSIFFLFLTDTEVCNDQIHPDRIVGDPTPIPR